MPNSDPTTILLLHNRWANEHLLDACAALSPEDLHRRFEMGLGSLHDTVLHILSAMRGWGDLLAGRPQVPGYDRETHRTVDELKALHAELADDLDRVVPAHPADEIVGGERRGRHWEFTRGAVVSHLMTHGVHHRAQCVNMLRHLGAETLPPSAVLEWILLVDDPPVG